MKILAVGGGSGGHVTPIAAVLNEVKLLQPDAELRVWCDRSFSTQTQELIRSAGLTSKVDTIYSGKFRRYHTIAVWKQLLRLRSIVLPNIRDGFLIVIGTMQSFVKLLLWRPDVVFCKGGYVCLPVGLAAKLLRIPIVLHDSDTHPGLANRILSRWAVSIATGSPVENYHYAPAKTHYVGIPIQPAYREYTKKERNEFKTALGYASNKPLIVITGGGLGAEALNDAIIAIAGELTVSCTVLLLSGTRQYEAVKEALKGIGSSELHVRAFIHEKVAQTFAAADLVVGRAGATTLLELAALAMPAIIVPNPYLTAGHQLKNAKQFADKNAVVLLDESELIASPHILLDTITSLIHNPAELQAMSDAMKSFAKPNSARDVAKLIVESIPAPNVVHSR